MKTLALLLILTGCKNGDDGFGGTGDRVDPPADTGPLETGGDTDTGDTSTPNDTADTGGTGLDTGDSADSADTGLDITGTGYGNGNVAYNLRAPDQSDDIWALYQQFGSVVLLTFGDATDPHFQEISSWQQALADEWGIVTAAMLMTNEVQTQASVQDAAEWASANGLDTVLYRPLDGSVSTASWSPYPPVTYVIDQEMVIEWTNQGNSEEGQVEDQIKDLVLGR